MMELRISRLDELNNDELEAFLLRIPESLLYVSPAYLRLLQAYLGCEIRLLIVRDGNEITGYFPLAFKTAAHGTVCNSLPFYGSNGGLLVRANDEAGREEARRLLLEGAEELLKEQNCVAATIISNPLDPDGEQFLRKNFRHGLVDERIGQLTPLPAQESDVESLLMSAFEDPRPRNIRKAQKSGVTVSASHAPEDMEFLCSVHRENISAIGGIPKEKRFFDTVTNVFPQDSYRIYIAHKDGERIAALLLFYFNKTVEYYTPAVIEAHRGLQPTALLVYQAMLDASRSGYRWWNWGGTWLSQGGVYDFKKKWGTEDHRYYYFTRVADPAILHLPKAALLGEYPNFFVVPFSALTS